MKRLRTSPAEVKPLLATPAEDPALPPSKLAPGDERPVLFPCLQAESLGFATETPPLEI